jgi:hypothetical protein
VEHDTAEAVMHLVGVEVEHSSGWGNALPLGNGGIAMATAAAARRRARAYAREEEE